MHYIIYKITNTINDKTYIGSHMTENLEDGYMGSGNLIKQAILKYGLSAFKKDIIFMALDEDGMIWAEEELVETYNVNPMSYNIVPGGGRPPVHKGMWITNGIVDKRADIIPEGFWIGRSNQRLTDSGRNAIIQNNKKWQSNQVKMAEVRKKCKENNAMKDPNNVAKVSISKIGCKWVTNGVQNIWLKPGEAIPEGYRFGLTKPYGKRPLFPGGYCKMKKKTPPEGGVLLPR